MPFKDTIEGQTHSYGDGCGIAEHNKECPISVMIIKKIKIVLTGGCGFIGSNLAKRLIDDGYDVHIIDNLHGGKIENISAGATFYPIDIRHREPLEWVMAGAEYVFHLAALPRVQYSIEHPVETNEVNIGGTLNVLIAAKNAKVKRVIYSASSSAYGNQTKMPLTETMTSNPQSPYGIQKHVGELYCKSFSEIHGLDTVSLRYFNVYGPNCDSDGAYALVIGKFLKQKYEGKPLFICGTGKNTRDFTHVSDVVEANILAMKHKKPLKGEVINIGAGNSVSILKLAKIIGGNIEHLAPRIEPAHTLADNSKARKILGWKPKILIEKGLKGLYFDGKNIKNK